jgi:hypothetical protein
VGYLTLAAVLVMTTVAAAGDNHWVSEDGETHAPHPGDDMLFIEDDAEVFNLADLADGETRVFGEGDRQVTVSRNGDVATISRPATDDDRKLDIECHLDSDVCEVTTFDGDSRRVMIMIQKTRECIDGEGDCDHAASALAFGEASGQITLHKTIACKEHDDDCEATIQHLSLGEGPGHATIVIERDGDAGAMTQDVFLMAEPGSGEVMIIKDDKATLRCPEGDVTMRVEREEKQDVFLCPKHSVPLEPVKAEKRVRKIRVKTKDDANEF